MTPKNQDLAISVREDLYETKQHGAPGYPLALYEVDSRNMHLELVHWHWHEELEFVSVTSGAARFFVGDVCYVLSAGDCLMINQNVLHRVKAYQDFDCKYYSVVFHPSLIFDPANTELREKYLIPVISHPQMKHFILKSDDENAVPIANILKKIILVNNLSEFGYEIVTKGLLCELWEHAIKGSLHRINSADYIADSQAILDEERIKGALTYIAAHYAEPIALQDIADSVHISKSECCRCFKRRLQITPFDYLIKYRIYSATILMVQHSGKVSVSEIALKTGFNSSSYFNKMFRKYIGCTPTQFRKTAGGDLENIQKIMERHIHPQDAGILNELISKRRPD
ncbi:MAG: helix-turn-helix domain-containing protein [Lachnospiraceae bacterium]|nr:helix-turn-helix domain-containing protein [Lachnospiraceae bacterium]